VFYLRAGKMAGILFTGLFCRTPAESPSRETAPLVEVILVPKQSAKFTSNAEALSNRLRHDFFAVF